MILEQKILDRFAKDIQIEIDTELMVDMLVSIGWTKIELPPFQNRYHAIDISDWAQDNCQGKYKDFKQYGRIFVFENAKDATAFALKWI